ncbi:MAG: nucleoside deaminase [Candidatus Thiodiazotropha sp.]|jgi:guanine deaminase
MPNRHEHFMQQALDLASQGVELGHGGPFGAVVVVADRVVGRGWNQVVHRQDPTAHAEMLAIREACDSLGRFHLPQATLYTTCEPCPMCMGAIYWARIGHLVYGATAEDAAEVGFDDHRIRSAMHQPLNQQDLQTEQRCRQQSKELFLTWLASDKRVDY